jgi:Uma2 family endonuclease
MGAITGAATGASTKLVTIREFIEWPEVEGERVELINGEVVSMPVGQVPHAVVKKNLAKIVVLWLAQNSTAELFAGTTYAMDELNAPIPDLSVLFPGRIGPRSTGWIAGAPELAIEVVSSETAARLDEKVKLYLSHGAKSMWVAYPKQRAVWVFDANGGAKRFEQEQILSDPVVLPGFSVSTAAIFAGL